MTSLAEQQPQIADTERLQRRSGFAALAAAVQFLTVLPPLVRRPFTAQELGRSVGWFPLIGALIGTAIEHVTYRGTHGALALFVACLLGAFAAEIVDHTIVRPHGTQP